MRSRGVRRLDHRVFYQPVRNPSAMKYEIALATYNGRRFLPELLLSIANQSLRPERILLADDGSTDGTRDLVSSLCDALCLPVVWCTGDEHLGACANFGRALLRTQEQYVFLADQDDVWDHNKAQRTLEAVLRAEQRWGSAAPVLAHSDLRIVDEELGLLANSYFLKQGLTESRVGFCDLLLQNVVIGCTTAVNRPLLEKALPIPTGAAMHDWWLALVAAAFGHIETIAETTIAYRQHGGNEVGARRIDADFIRKKVHELRSRSECASKVLSPVVTQAQAWIQRFGAMPDGRGGALVRELCSFRTQTGTERIKRALLLGARRHGLLRTVAFYWALLWGKFGSE